MEYDSKEEVALFAGHAVGGILVILLIGSKQDFGELTYVRREIMPAGFVDIVVNVFGFHQADHVVGVKNTVSVGVRLIVQLYPALDVILGNVEPEADALCVFKRDRLTVNTETDPGVLLGVRILGGKTVGFQTHRVVAVMDLTVFSVSQAQIQLIIPMRSILSVVNNVPLINISLTAFKVPKNFGALAEVKLNGCGGVFAHIESCGNCTGQIIGCTRFAYSSKFETVKATECSVGRGKGHVIFVKTDFVSNTVNGCRCLYGDRSGLTVRNGYNGLSKRKCIRCNNSDFLFTNNFTVINELSGYDAFSTVGFKHTVCNRTHVFFFDLPLCTCRNINLGTYGVKPESAEVNGTPGGIVVIVGRDLRARKYAVRFSGRNYKDGIGGRSFTAIGKRAVDLQFFTGTLRAERGRTATVTVCGNDTTHLDHIFCHFIRGKAGGVGCLFTVGNGNHKRTVRSDTDERSGGNTGAVVFLVLVHGVAVGIGLNQKTEQNRDRLLFPTSQRVGNTADPCLGHIIGSLFTCNGMIVVVDNHNGLYAASCKSSILDSAVAVILTIQDGVTERLTDQVRVLLIIIFSVPAE